MALWQYSFFILPQIAEKIIEPKVQFHSQEDGFETEHFWKLAKTEKAVFEPLNEILPKVLSWSSNIEQFGDLEGNVLEIYFNRQNIVESVSFRIDFRSDFKVILSSIVKFCLSNSFIILDEELRISTLNYKILNELIVSSPQVKKYKFLSGG